MIGDGVDPWLLNLFDLTRGAEGDHGAVAEH